jgi:hypothetical protein
VVASRPEMRVESARQDGDDAEVVTSGGRFRFLADGRVEAEQRLPTPRACFVATLRGPRSPWRVAGRDESTAITLQRDGLTARVRDDATVTLAATRETAVDVAAAFVPDHVVTEPGASVVLDGSGGFACYRHRATSIRDRVAARSTRAPGIEEAVGPGAWLRLAVLPSRAPTLEHIPWNLAHEGTPREPLPSDGAIADAARTCRVLALHAYIWRAAPWRLRLRPGRYFLRSNAWRALRHEPADPDGLARATETARRHGMRVVLYVSPRHTTAPDVFEEMARVLDVHRPDGLYLDGVTALRGGEGLVRLEHVVRRTRALLGPERLLYLHPGDEPFGSPLATCPFVDAHADFVLRGSAGRGGLPLERFLRYAVAGWNVSGAVGVWCHYGSSGRLLPVERAPSGADVVAAARNHVRVWRRSRWGEGALRTFDAAWAEASAAMVRTETARARTRSRNSP